MEFRRIEVRKVLRHCEQMTDIILVREVLDYMRKYDLRFCMRMAGVGSFLRECTVTKLKDKTAIIFSNRPVRISLEPTYEAIEVVEVESNCDFISEERDEGGRWANVI